MAANDDIQALPAARARRRVRRAEASREAKSARMLLWLIPTVVGLILGARMFITSRPMKVAIARRLAGDIANRSKAAVRLGGLSFGWAYQPCIQRFELYRLNGDFEVGAQAEEGCVERWASAVGSAFRAVQIKLKHPSILIQGSAREGSAKSLLVDVQPSTSTGAITGLKRRYEPLREFEVAFDDLKLDWLKLPLPERIAAGSLGPIDGALTIQRRGGQSAVSISVREPRTGLQLTGRANPTEDGWDLAAHAEGDLAPSFGAFLDAAGLDIRRLPVQGELGVVYSNRDKKAVISVDFEEFDVDVANEIVSSHRLVGFKARERFRVDVDLNSSTLSIRDGLIEVNGIPAVFSLDIRPGVKSPAFTLSSSLRTVPMAKLLRSIPGTEPAVLEMVEGMSPSVLFALTFTISGELRDPRTWQPKLEYRILGVGAHAAGSGLETLNEGTFNYYPLLAEGRSKEPKRIGSESPGWVSYSKVPYLQRRSVQVSEDADFFVHNGINIDEMRAAIVEGFETGKKTRGGSTLTQQLVKNLFLSRERTAARKVQEFFLTLLVETALSKERIFELYLNVIEWGPGIYGLKEASEYYFNRPPSGLNPREMAYLTSIIPGPLLFHRYFEAGHVPDKHMWKVNFLLDRMSKLGSVKEEDLAGFLAEPIRFARHNIKHVEAPPSSKEPLPEKLPDIVPDLDSPE